MKDDIETDMEEEVEDHNYTKQDHFLTAGPDLGATDTSENPKL